MAIKISQMAEAPSLDGSELLEVSKLSSTITITASTISALASDNSFNDSGSGFLDAGFAVGDQVNVTGFSGDTANNIFSGKIQTLTSAKMVIESPAGDAIVNDSAGESVTITKWETVRTTTQDVADLASPSGGGGGLDGLTFTSDTGSTADSDPGNGLMKWNHATQSSATVLYFDNQTLDAISLTTFYTGLPASGYIYMEQEDDDSKWQLWKWSAVTDGTGYRKFTVTSQAYGGAIADDKTVLVDFAPGVPGPNVQSVTSSATVTPTFDNDGVKITAQAAGLTLNNPTGTAKSMWGWAIRIKDNGTARSIAYDTQYRAVGVTLPTSTVISKTLYLGCIWNSDDSKVDVVAVAQEA